MPSAGCYWHGEVVFGGVEGVTATSVGFVGKVEVVRVTFNHRKVAYTDLIEVWKDNHEIGLHTSDMEQSAIYPAAEQNAEASLMLKLFRGRKGGCGQAEVRPLLPASPFRLGKESDQLYHLRKTAPKLLELGLSPELLGQINSCIGMKKDYKHLLPKTAAAEDDSVGLGLTERVRGGDPEPEPELEPVWRAKAREDYICSS